MPALPALVPVEQHWYRRNTSTTEPTLNETLNETLGLAEMALLFRDGALLPPQRLNPAHCRARRCWEYQACMLVVPSMHVVSTKHACWEYQACMLKLQVYAGATFAMVEDDGVYTVCAHSQFDVPS